MRILQPVSFHHELPAVLFPCGGKIASDQRKVVDALSIACLLFVLSIIMTSESKGFVSLGMNIDFNQVVSVSYHL